MCCQARQRITVILFRNCLSDISVQLTQQIPICCSIFIFKLYHKTCEQFYRHFGLYEKSPNSFLPGLPRSIINQFDFHNFLCLCLASVHLPCPFHLVSAFSFSVTPFRFANSGTISSMRFRAASSILAQYCLTYTQQSGKGLFAPLLTPLPDFCTQKPGTAEHRFCRARFFLSFWERGSARCGRFTS